MDRANGVDAATLFQDSGLTYDDFILLPGYIKCALSDIELDAQLTRRIPLKLPVVSSR